MQTSGAHAVVCCLVLLACRDMAALPFSVMPGLSLSLLPAPRFCPSAHFLCFYAAPAAVWIRPSSLFYLCFYRSSDCVSCHVNIGVACACTMERGTQYNVHIHTSGVGGRAQQDTVAQPNTCRYTAASQTLQCTSYPYLLREVMVMGRRTYQPDYYQADGHCQAMMSSRAPNCSLSDKPKTSSTPPTTKFT